MSKAIANRRSKPAAWLLAGLLVLLAQTISTIHDLDPQSAAPDHACEICVAAASLDSVDVGHTAIVFAAPAAAEPFIAEVETVAVAPLRLPPSRGPPATS